MKAPFVKEHGAWFVFILSCAAGIIAGSLSAVQPAVQQAHLKLALVITGMALLINAKASAVLLIRSKNRRGRDAAWLLFFSFSGILLLIPFLTERFLQFLPFAMIVAAYFILLVINKEHLIITEIIGFSLLSAGGAVTYFIITGALSVKLYAAVFIFFCAGVFKVRLRLKKRVFYRQVMVVYCFAAAGIYMMMGISSLILLPLVENIFFSIRPRDETLKVTGNTELAKGLVFLLLLGLFFTK